MFSKLNNYYTFIAIFLAGMVIYFSGEESKLWSVWGAVDISFAVALGVVAIPAYIELTMGKDDIKVILKDEDRGVTKDTNLKLLRKDSTRGEILGVLGMIQKDPKKRFYIAPERQRKLLKEIIDVQQNRKKREIYIFLSEKEFEQFEVEEINRKNSINI